MRKDHWKTAVKHVMMVMAILTSRSLYDAAANDVPIRAQMTKT